MQKERRKALLPAPAAGRILTRLPPCTQAKEESHITDILVPIMSVVYVLTVLVMVAMNLERLPWFFYAVMTEAFHPEPIFGGALGIAPSQGIKRGLMSNVQAAPTRFTGRGGLFNP